MSYLRGIVLLLAYLLFFGPASAAVVINEILYHAPDDLDDLQFIELHNTGAAEVELSGWKLGREVNYEFPRGTKIAANGYLVVCKSLPLFSATTVPMPWGCSGARSIMAGDTSS